MILLKLFWVFFKIGIFTFGGGYAMIPLLEKEVVEINHWLSAKELTEIISVDAVTPGPIAVNLATFVGYKVNGVIGAIIATIGVILPSLIIVLAIASLFYAFKNNEKVQAVLKGLKPAVIALIAAALFSLIQKKTIIDYKSIIILIIVFFGVAIFKIHPIPLVLLAGLAGFLLY